MKHMNTVTPATKDTWLGRLNLWSELAFLALLVMELCWVTPWFRALAPTARANPLWRSFGGLAALLAGAVLLARLLNGLNIKMRLRQGALVLFLLGSLLAAFQYFIYSQRLQAGQVGAGTLLNVPLSSISQVGTLVPEEFIVAAFVLLLTWRGYYLAREFAGSISIFGELRLGVIMWSAFGLIITRVTGQTPGNLLYVFLAAVLIGLVSGRVAGLARLRGGTRNTFNRQWLGGIGGATALIVAGAAGLAALVIRQMEALLQFIRHTVYIVFAILSIPFLILLGLVEPSIDAIQRAIPTLTPAPASLLPTVAEQAAMPENIVESMDPLAALIAFLKPVLIWGSLAMVALFILMRFSRWTNRPEAESADERQSILTGSFLDWLKAALRGQLAGAARSLAQIGKLQPRQQHLAAEHIRQVYAHLLELTAQLGQPRPEAQTPLEFLPAMQMLFAERPDDLRLVTDSYLKVRYGSLPETIQEIQQVDQAWERIAMEGKEKLKTLKT